MDTTSNHMYARQATNGITMVRGAIMAGFLVSTLLTALPSVTFADGRDGDRRDNRGKHSLVQHPHNSKNPFVVQQATMQATINALTVSVNQLITDNGMLKDALSAAQANISAMQGTVTTMQGTVTTVKGSVDAVKDTVIALEAKTADSVALSKYVKVDTKEISGMSGPHVLITGANVHVRSGSGFTNDNGSATGLGNLIIGYNENTTPTPILVRNGSHNLVGGSLNSFSSYGGVVFGVQNVSGMPYASVLGGNENRAQGQHSTVYGGFRNMAVNLNSYAPAPAPSGK